MAFRTASATSLRTAAFRQALGSHVMFTKGMVCDERRVSDLRLAVGAYSGANLVIKNTFTQNKTDLEQELRVQSRLIAVEHLQLKGVHQGGARCACSPPRTVRG